MPIWLCCPADAPHEVHISATESTVYVSGKLREQLERRAEAEGLTVREIVHAAIGAATS